MTHLGRVPVVGDRLKIAGAVIAVTQMQGRRVTQLALLPPAPAEDEEVHL